MVKTSFKGLKIKVSRQEALDSIKNYVYSFGWSSFKFVEIDRLKVFMIPFYLFHFDVFKSDENNKVFDQTSGVLSLDAVKNKLDAKVSRFFGLHEVVEKIDLDSDSLEYKLLESKISDDKAEEIIKVKLASKFGVPRENVIISGKELLFIPVYYSEIELNGENFLIKVNGFDGEIFSNKKLPVKQKDLNELFSETINDLKQPNNWINYSTSSVSTAVNANSGVLFQFMVLILVLLIIIVVFVLLGWF